MQLRSIVLTVTVLSSGPLFAGEPGVRLEPGEPLPDLRLPALDDGRPESLRNFRGKRLVLHVFASW